MSSNRAVLLREGRHAGPGTAAAGLVAFQSAEAIGRFVGDRLVDRIGPAGVFRASALLGGGGLAAGILLGSTPSAVAGLGLFGLGVANLLPISVAASGTYGAVAVAVARISTLAYAGSFAGPALIGGLARFGGVPAAMLLPAGAVAVTALAAPTVRPQRRAAALGE